MAGSRRSSGLHRLTVREVQAAREGDHSDGGGLLLRVRDAGVRPDGRTTAATASWVFRYTAPGGRRREMGLGVARRGSATQAGESLLAARRQAHEARDLLLRSVDPIDERDRRRDAERQADEARRVERARASATLARVARDYHERVIEPTRTRKHAADWIASLEHHLPASIWKAPINEVTPPALLEALVAMRPHERARRVSGDRIAETTQRVRQRLEAIFEDAIFNGLCSTNPAAAVVRKLQEAMGRRVRGRLRALDYRKAPALMKRLRDREGVAARCLEFAVLTTSRTGEVLRAEWSEIDLDAATWTVPAARMKGREEHAVYLSDRAVEIVKLQQGQHTRWVFPSPSKADSPLSNMAMLVMLDRLGVRAETTVHGLCRASFSTWANETGAARPDVIEACLAHEEGNRVRAAYNRAKFADERRTLLLAWADYLARPANNVVSLRQLTA